MINNLEIVLRLILSALVGGAIGVEREVSNRPAGLRTHILVSVGATLITLISIYSFPSGDSARVAAQIVSGIGFLGAGTILRTGDNVTGLTTAASLWVCGGIGMAVGSGYYLGALVAAVIVLLVLATLSPLERRIFGSSYASIEIAGVERPGLIGDIGGIFGRFSITIKDIKIYGLDGGDDSKKRNHNNYKVMFTVKLPMGPDIQEISKEIFSIQGVSSVLYNGIDASETES